MKIKFTLIQASIMLISLYFISEIKAQDFIWNTGFNGFFDNREYYNNYSHPQTMFGARTFVSVGLTLYENYSIVAGLDALYEFGTYIDAGSIEPIIFFQFYQKPVKLLLGSFHRKKLVNLPYALQTDTIHYYKPNIEGIFIEFRKSWGFQNTWIDWTSRQTSVKREIFNIGGTGMLKKSIFFYKHDFIITHYALPANSQPDDHIRDNGGFFARIGIFNSKPEVLDSLSFSSGYTMSYDRLRGVYDFNFRNGSLSELYFQYKGFGISSSLYIGEGQTQMEGDALYSATFYNRNDFFWKIFRKDRIEGKVEFSLHVIEDVIDVSQALRLYVNIGGSKTINSGN